MFDHVVLLAMAPPLTRGHLIALLRNKGGSEYFDLDDPDLRVLNDRVMKDSENLFHPSGVFLDGPLAGIPINSVSLEDQARFLAPRLVIADAGGMRLLESEFNHLGERVFTSFLIDGYTRLEIMDAVDAIGGSTATAETFLNIYHGLNVVMMLE